ncbi:MAG: hypothetical protein CMJ84_14885 [Planctomycetes bacterium]|jgi:serine phosphatase RsbU (regulator of sigma subunit)|nr:hypothetical protein [Planctomycetota bacterium]MDP6410909.1 SpoIIE family protein phosphatase [Planctomycetota bacterium]
MTRAAEQDRRVGGLPLRAKFTLAMSLSLAAVMVVAGYLLKQSISRISANSLENRVIQGLELSARELQSTNFEQQGEKATSFRGSPVLRYDAIYGMDRGEVIPAWYYEYRDPNLPDGQKRPARFLIPKETAETDKGVGRLIAGITLVVIIVGGFVALLVSNHVVQPINAIVNDIRQIARGNLHHRSRVKAGGEVALLARTVNRMAEDLEEAQEVEIELSVREREMEVANEVREALHVESTPACAGYDLGGIHIGAAQPGGDFHDFIASDEGRVGVLVCGVSGQGVPGALVGATARAYLRSELSRSVHCEDALRRVNRFLAMDVRRGMYVTAMYVLIDPQAHTVDVACAGHKVPLLHYVAAKRSLRLIQPEGIALGFDKGPVFDRTLQVQRIVLESEDRIVLANTGPVSVQDEEGDELGERPFYKLVHANAGGSTASMLAALEEAVSSFAGDQPFPNDITIASVKREG